MVVLHGLILHDDHAAIVHVFEQPVLVRDELRPRGIGAHAQQNDVVFLQIAAGDILRAQELHVDAEVFERLAAPCRPCPSRIQRAILGEIFTSTPEVR